MMIAAACEGEISCFNGAAVVQPRKGWTCRTRRWGRGRCEGGSAVPDKQHRRDCQMITSLAACPAQDSTHTPTPSFTGLLRLAPQLGRSPSRARGIAMQLRLKHPPTVENAAKFAADMVEPEAEISGRSRRQSK
jgi:hypothetical protein